METLMDYLNTLFINQLNNTIAETDLNGIPSYETVSALKKIYDYFGVDVTEASAIKIGECLESSIKLLVNKTTTTGAALTDNEAAVIAMLNTMST